MSVTTVDRERIAARYARPPRRWIRWVIALPLVVVLGGWLWISVFHASTPIRAAVSTFTTTQTTIQVELMLDRNSPGDSGRCLVHAEAYGGERVGELWVDVPPAAEKVTHTRVDIRAFRPPVTAVVDRCEQR